MNAEDSFAKLAPYINHIQNNVMTAPLNANQRARLATMIAGSFCSVAVDANLFDNGVERVPTLNGRQKMVDKVLNTISDSLMKITPPKLDS